MNVSRIGLGLLVLAALALHAWSMGQPNLPHMLWSCHVASAVLAIGLLLNRITLVAAGFLFHLAIGFPAWLIEVVVSRGTFGASAVTPRVLATSILVHSLPLIAGALYLRRRPIPAASLALAWLLQIAMVPVSRWTAPPEFNVNLAHSVWRPIAGTSMNWWFFQIVVYVVTLASLLLIRAVWNGFVPSKRRGFEQSLV
jgi:hypothetical protein